MSDDLPPSRRHDGRDLPSSGPRDAIGAAGRAVEEAWARDEVPDLEALRAAWGGPAAPPAVVAALIKADLRGRYARGQRPAVADYLGRFPELRAARDRVVSLVYEEYCLREEGGAAPDPASFCARYPEWQDSLISQLGYHQMLSRVVAPMPPPRFPAPGERFQGYDLLEELGRGGVARVFLAREREVADREVALKVSADRGKESSIQGRLDHPHIASILSVTPTDPATGLRGLSMLYRPGRALDRVLERLGPPGSVRRGRRTAAALWKAVAEQAPDGAAEGPSEPGWAGYPHHGSHADAVAWVGLVLARALGHAHGRGVLHLDVKPANVLMTLRGGPLLIDFNLSHHPHAADQAEVAMRGGTLPYMAPEQLAAFLDRQRWAAVGPAADLYSLGLVLRELLTGRRPETPPAELPLPRAIAELLDRRSGPPAPMRAEAPDVSHALEAIVGRCLVADPAARYPGAAALAEDLARYLARRPPCLAANPSRRERAAFWASRNRRALAGVVAVMLALAVAIPMLQKVARERSSAEATRRSAEAAKLDIQGWGLLANKQFQAAETNFRAALRLDDRRFSAHQGLASVAWSRGAPDEAERQLSRALALASLRSPEEFEALGKRKPAVLATLHYERARARIRQGHRTQRALDFPGARAAYAAALDDLRLSGGTPEEAEGARVLGVMAEMGLGDVESARGGCAGAVALYEHALADLTALPVAWRINKTYQELEAELTARLARERPQRDAERVARDLRAVAATIPATGMGPVAVAAGPAGL